MSQPRFGEPLPDEESDQLDGIIQAEIEDQLLFGDDTPDAAPRDDEVRPDLLEKVIAALIADGKRGDGTLVRADVNRAYVRRHLTIAECVLVEQRLSESGVEVVDEEEPEEGSNTNVAYTPGRTRYLSESEERDLGRRIQLAIKLTDAATQHDGEFSERVISEAHRARELLVETNQRWVKKLARRMGSQKHLSDDDIYQEGMLGLLRAAELYDPEKGFRFKTYATWWIEQHMHRAIDNYEREVRLPVHLKEKLRRIHRAERALILSTGKRPNLQTLADAVGMDSVQLGRLLWRVQATNCIEGDAEVGEEEKTTILELIADQTTMSPHDIVSGRQLTDCIGRVLQALTPREERVIRLRFGIGVGQGETLESIGGRFGVTRERIRQIEAKALRKLKHPSRSRNLRNFLD